jgi:hypothetical protein
MRRQFFFTMVLTIVVVLLAWGTNTQAMVAKSEFNLGDGGDGRDGWIGNYPEDGYTGRDYGDTGGWVRWDGDNGLPPGCLKNYEPGILYLDGFVAPAKFLGNWWAQMTPDSYISFDYKKVTFVEAYPFNVRIVSGETDFWVFDVVSQADLDWHKYILPLDESLWRHQEGSKSWEESLGNITEFFISGDVYIGPESNYLDNVELVPEPATILLISLGGFALLRKRRA